MIPAYSIDPARQYHIQVAKGEVGRYVLLPGDPKRCAKIAQYFDDPVLIADSREFVTYTGTVDGIRISTVSTGIGGPSAAIALEEYTPIEYPAVPDFEVMCALREAAVRLNERYHIGVVHCKDAFYGQHNPELLPQSSVLMQKWDAYLRMGCLASEMESATLFIVGGYRKVRTGTVLLTMANQTRAAKGLSNPIVHDTDSAIRTAIEAVRILDRKDRE